MSPSIFARRIIGAFICLMVTAFVASEARADTINATCVANVCTVVTTNSDGLAVNAKATFAMSANTVTVTLENLLTQDQMRAVNQAITGVLFTVVPGSTTGTLTSSNGAFTNFGPGDVATPDGNGTTNWQLNNNPLQLCMLCANPGNPDAPENAIIGGTGSGVYANASGSLNNAHDPFLYGPVVFTMTIQGVTDASVVSAVSIRFNTSLSGQTEVPEPASMLLLGTGLVGVAAGLRRRNKKR